MTSFEYSDSVVVVVAAGADAVYALVSDVTRTGEWSPVCRACWWDDGAGPHVGAWFTGRNETPGRTWETRSQVVQADLGREFGWEVDDAWARWGFTLEPLDGGTRLTEYWAFLPKGRDGFREIYGDDADTQIADRTEAAHRGIPETLAAIKRIAEAD